MNNEPVSISAALTLVLTSGVALIAILVPDLTQAAQIAIIGFGNALIILGAAIWARMRTTPLAAPVIPAGTAVTVTTPAGAPNGTATLDVAPTGTVTATPS